MISKLKQYWYVKTNYDLIFQLNIEQLSENDDDEGGELDGPNVLDKEKNLMNEDPKWQGIVYTYIRFS